MKVCLLLCPVWDVRHPPASLALLSALLKREGHDVEVLDLNHRMSMLDRACGADQIKNHATLADPWVSPELVRERLIAPYRKWLETAVERSIDRGVRLVGFSVYDTNAAMSVELARLFKAKDPAVKVVFGGPSCLTMPEALSHMRHECVDAVVLGEADVSFPRLARALEKTGRLEASRGVLLREDPSTWKEGQDILQDLDVLPFADFSAYGSAEQFNYSGKMLHTTRGCVRKCTYCADWREMPWRQMSPSRIFEEFAHQAREHPKATNFLFGDSLLNSSVKNLSALCDRLIESRLKVVWHGYAIARPDMTPDVLAKMKQAGCIGLYYGIESGSSRVLLGMNKQVPPGLNERVVRDTAAAGIEAGVLLVVGFPGETEECFQETLDFIEKNAAGIGWLNLSLFEIRPEMRAWSPVFDHESGQALLWRDADGANTIAVRLKRLRRAMELADRLGIRTLLQGTIPLEGLAEYEENLLSRG